MAYFFAHAWVRFTAGLVAGCWIGAAVGVGITLLLAGRRLRQLESANLLLRTKLMVKERQKRKVVGGAGPVLVIPPPGSQRPAGGGLGRVVNGR